MAVTTTKTNKPLNPRGNDQSPKGYNRAELYSGKALDFDGTNDQVEVTTSEVDFGADSFSVSAVVDWSGSHGDGKLAYAERGSANSQLAAWQIRTDGNGNMLFQANTAADGWQAVTFSGVEAIIADGLTHLTFVRVGTGATLYINGQFYSNGTGSIQATLDAANGNFCIGNRLGVSNYWNGKIGQYKIFSGALTADQVADLYNNPEKIVPTGVSNDALKLWLPMQEGAGTTAYDGSGNGNHGTISGATWQHGIGAPVSQTAVIDWNKGTNSILNTEDFTASTYTITAYTRSEADATAPNGLSNAARYKETAANSTRSIQFTGYTFGTSEKQVIGVFAKYDGAQYIQFAGLGLQADSEAPVFDIQNGVVHTALTSDNCESAFIEDAGNGWYKCSAVCNPSGGALFQVHGTSQIVHTADTFQGDTNDGFYLWGPFQIENEDTKRIYIPNPTGSEISSDVLLPAGLTTGRDITGVNLFENVRKQGALNLDGNSWAEVHDNASLDFGTGSFTFEAWAKYSYVSQGSSLNAILSLGGDIGQGAGYGRAGLVSSSSGSSMSFFYNSTGNASTSSFSDGDWVHVVGVYDETSAIIYINGAEERTTARTAATMTNADVKQIGRDSTAIRYYNDQIAQPRIYNRALTAEEVERNYTAGKYIYTND